MTRMRPMGGETQQSVSGDGAAFMREAAPRERPAARPRLRVMQRAMGRRLLAALTPCRLFRESNRHQRSRRSARQRPRKFRQLGEGSGQAAAGAPSGPAEQGSSGHRRVAGAELAGAPWRVGYSRTDAVIFHGTSSSSDRCRKF
jgi:hypothetical protein